MDSRTSAGCVATSKPLTRGGSRVGLSSVDRIFTTVVLPAPLEPSRAKMLPLATSNSTPRSTLQLLVGLLQALHVDRLGRRCGHRDPSASPVSSPAARVDVAGQPFPLPGDVPALRVVRDERLDELDRVVSDDVADRRSVRRGALEQVGDVFEQRTGAVGIRRPEVHEVPLDRIDRAAIVREEAVERAPCTPATAAWARSPSRSKPPDSVSDMVICLLRWSCSSRSARNLQVVQNSSRYACP